MVLDVLGLAHQYGFVELETAISDYLKAILNIRNVCMIYDMASLFHLSSLAEVCCSFVDRNALDIIHHESFLTLSAVSILLYSKACFLSNANFFIFALKLNFRVVYFLHIAAFFQPGLYRTLRFPKTL